LIKYKNLFIIIILNMRLFLTLCIVFLAFSNIVDAGRKSYYDGSGSLKISTEVAQSFANYVTKNLKTRKGDDPITFWVTEDGNNAYWWTSDGNSCSRGWDNEIYIVSMQNVITFGVVDMCKGKQHIEKFADECESFYDMECKIFAKVRVVTWDNGINPGRSKESKFNSRWSDERIYSKLKELGFDFKEPIIKKTTSSKTTESKTTENDDLIDQLKL